MAITIVSFESLRPEFRFSFLPQALEGETFGDYAFRLFSDSSHAPLFLPMNLACRFGYSLENAYHVLCSVCRTYLLEHELEIVLLHCGNSQILNTRRDFTSLPLHMSENAAVYSVTGDYLAQDRPFADMCEWWCARKAISKNEFYVRSNINKAMFWNMKHHPEQVPKKTSVLACAIGLRLNLDEARDLLLRAGHALSRYYLLDRIVESYIREKIYDIDEINAALFDEGQLLLGSSV